MFANLLAHRIDLIQSALHGLRPGNFAGHPDGKENRGKIALAHARDVDTAVAIPRPQIKLAVEETLRGVVVRIHYDRRKMKLFSSIGNSTHRHRTRHQENPHRAQPQTWESSRHSFAPAAILPPAFGY